MCHYQMGQLTKAVYLAHEQRCHTFPCRVPGDGTITERPHPSPGLHKVITLGTVPNPLPLCPFKHFWEVLPGLYDCARTSGKILSSPCRNHQPLPPQKIPMLELFLLEQVLRQGGRAVGRLYPML